MTQKKNSGAKAGPKKGHKPVSKPRIGTSTYKNNAIIDEAMIDQVYAVICNEHVSLMSACDFLMIDPSEIIRLQRQGSIPGCQGLAAYAYDMLRQAGAWSEIQLVRGWLVGDVAKQDLLEATNDRYRQKHQLHVTYEVTAILDIAAHYTTPAQFKDIVSAVSRMNGEETIRLLDAKVTGDA